MRAQTLRYERGSVLTARRRRPQRVASYLEQEPPANVQDARKWIASWKQRQARISASSGSHAAEHNGAPTVSVPSGGDTVAHIDPHAGALDTPANVREARLWIAAWKERTSPPPSSALNAPPVAAEAPSSSVSENGVAPGAPANVEEAEPKPCAHTASEGEVPANVQEARGWIAAWKQQRADASAASALATSPARADNLEPQATKDVSRTPTVLADGALVFSKDLLDSASYEDLMKILQEKAHRLKS